MRRSGRKLFLMACLGWLVCPGVLRGQAPTIENTQMMGSMTAAPGSSQSRLGTMPGAGSMILGNQPGSGSMLLNRIGTAAPRVPAAITMPGQGMQIPQPTGITVPAPLPVPRAPLYGTLSLPTEEASEGPANGLTLDQAIEILVHNNPDLLSKRMEIPQARADILTASLRQPDTLRRQSACPLRSLQRSQAGRPDPV